MPFVKKVLFGLLFCMSIINLLYIGLMILGLQP